MHGRDRLHAGDAARADRPDGFIGDRQPVRRRAFGQRSEQLVRDDLFGATGIAHCDRFPHAQDDVDPRLVRGDGLGRDIGIGFAARLAPFAMAGDDPGGAGFRQHLGRERSGIGAADIHMAVLRADEGGAAPFRPRHDERGGQAQPDFHRRMRRRDPADRLDLIQMRPHPVHLPVADNQLSPVHPRNSSVIIAARSACARRRRIIMRRLQDACGRWQMRWTGIAHLSSPSLAAAPLRP